MKAASYANDVLDQTLPNAASGSVTIGASVYTLPFRVIFLSTVSTDTTQGSEWPTGGGYTSSAAGGATGGVSLAGLVTAAATSKAKANTGAISVANAPAGTWADVEIHDSTTGTQKRVAFKGTPSLAKTVNVGDTCVIPAGSFTANDA